MPAAGTAGSVFVSGGFGKLSMGDVDSAANAIVEEFHHASRLVVVQQGERSATGRPYARVLTYARFDGYLISQNRHVVE